MSGQGCCPVCKTTQMHIYHITFECENHHKFDEHVYAASSSVPVTDNRDKPTGVDDPRPTMNIPARPARLDKLTMPFGKYKGSLIEDLESDYIYWCLENLDKLNPRLKEEMQNQLTLRSGKGVERS